MAELKALGGAVTPRNVVLVLDAAIGQESVHVARAFHEAVGLTGLVLTKLDGDARGGAALSVQSVMGCPVLLAGTGEKTADLEPFHPERMASRILGMGDVVTLVEKAQATLDGEALTDFGRKLKTDALTLEDFLAQLRHMKRLGPLDQLLDLLPGGGRVPEALRAGLKADPGRDLKRAEAIILSMTPEERRHPERIDGRRRARIARGSGTLVRDVNELLKRFQQSRKMMKQMTRQQKRLLRRGR